MSHHKRRSRHRVVDQSLYRGVCAELNGGDALPRAERIARRSAREQIAEALAEREQVAGEPAPHTDGEWEDVT